MKFKLSNKMIKVLIFIFFTIAPLIILMNLDSFDYYSAFAELQRATGVDRKDLEIMNYWRRGSDYVVKVRIYRDTGFKVKFVKHEDSFRAELAEFYDEGWKPIDLFLKENNLVRENNGRIKQKRSPEK